MFGLFKRKKTYKDVDVGTIFKYKDSMFIKGQYETAMLIDTPDSGLYDAIGEVVTFQDNLVIDKVTVEEVERYVY